MGDGKATCSPGSRVRTGDLCDPGMTRSGRLLPLPMSGAPHRRERVFILCYRRQRPNFNDGERRRARDNNLWVRPLDQPLNIENAPLAVAEPRR